MILHIVTFSFKEYRSWSSLEVIEAEKRTRNHPSHINQIKGWICGRNITNRSIASDFVVVGLFANRKDLDEYLVHHDHREGVTKWKEVATWNVVDIDLEEDSSQITGALGLVNNLNLREKSLEEVC